MDKSSWSSCTFELEDIEIIDHKNEKEEDPGMWSCDQCSLFFLEQGKLNEHKKTHIVQNVVRCKYCDKTISMSEVNRECFLNRKCETCEYKCSKCPQRFLRHSSLVNHEKKHASPKKKRILPGNRKVNYVCPDKVAVLSKGVKRKQSKAFDSEEQREGFKKIKRNMNMNNSPKKKFNTKIKAQESSGFGENSAIKPPKRMSLKADKVEVKKNCENSPVKENKRASLQLSSASVNLQAGPPTANVSSSENVVNYKPFSCHVCGDTFASDGALLSHIKTHGESAAKSFKCKFCGDEFDDIYKMQYHLAICPLAEDELEISLKQVIPVNVSTTFSGGTSSPRKRGRPKKVEPPLNQESCTENEPTQPSVKMGKSRKRKSGVLENASQTEPSSKQSKKSLNEETLTASNNNIDAGENVNNTLSSNVTEVTGEVELDEDKKKLHRCPFPRCDFKFTREKALLCHMRNHSDDLDDSLKCHKCDIPFDDVHTLRLHINTCKGIKEEKDDDFNRAGPYDSSPNRTFQRAMKKDFVCNQCGKSHHSQDKLDRHLESCGSKFVCRICKDDFLNQPLLDEHFGSKHPPKTPYHCYTCEEDFISELFLQIHQTNDHGQNLNNNPMQERVKEKEPTFSAMTDVESSAVSKCSSRYSKNRRIKNVVSNPCITRIAMSTVNEKTSKYAKRNSMNPVSDTPIRCTTRNGRFFWCPICLLDFEKRDNLRDHLREKHVIKNNSSYACEICGVKVPFAEMMCYHLELHSSNLLSVNRFSKIASFVKQNRVGCLTSSGVKIKHEEVSDDETLSQAISAVDCQEMSKLNKEKSKKRVHTPTKKMASSNISLQRKIRPEDEVFHQNSTVFHLESSKEYCNDLSSERKGKANKNYHSKIEQPVKNVSVIENSKKRLKARETIHKETNIVKPSRSLRSRDRVDSFKEEDKRVFTKQKVKLETFSDEDDEEIKPLKKKDAKCVEIDSKALKPTKAKTRGMDSAVGQVKRRDQQRKLRGSNTKKHITLGPNSNPLFNTEKTVHPENQAKPSVYLDNSNKEMILSEGYQSVSSLKKETEFTTSQTKRLRIRKRGRRSLYSCSKRKIKCSKSNIQSDLKENLLSNSESVVSTDTLSKLNDSEGENNILDSLVDKESVENNFGLNIVSEASTTQPVTQRIEQTNCELKEETSDKVTKKYNELDTRINVQSEDSSDSPVIGIAEKFLDKKSENLLPLDCEVQVQEESRISAASSTGESEGICCTMCSERFCHQDDLLDHLSTHI